MRDQDDDILDEDPSDEDLQRFSGEEAFCPDCGAQIWDAVEVCPKCFAYIGGKVSHMPKHQRWFNAKVITIIVILLLISMFWFLL